jgi:hypothetical protein
VVDEATHDPRALRSGRHSCFAGDARSPGARCRTGGLRPRSTAEPAIGVHPACAFGTLPADSSASATVAESLESPRGIPAARARPGCPTRLVSRPGRSEGDPRHGPDHSPRRSRSPSPDASKLCLSFGYGPSLAVLTPPASPLSTVHAPAKGYGLELKHDKAGVSVGDSTRTGVRASESASYATHDGPKVNENHFVSLANMLLSHEQPVARSPPSTTLLSLTVTHQSHPGRALRRMLSPV